MSYRVLFVGDPHVTVEDIPDCQKLMDLSIDIAKKEKAILVILGDLHHNHAVIRLEVLNFWTSIFNRLEREKVYWIALVGNHDMSGNRGDREGNSLIANAPKDSSFGVVVSRPCGLTMLPGLAFFPYIDDSERFLVEAKEYRHCTGIICHQTFNGSKYENGFYAKDGVDPNLITQEFVISGHIHTPQEFNKIIYPGSPRWRTISDANIKRYIWLYEFLDTGHIKSKLRIESPCKQIYLYEDRQNQQDGLPLPKHLDPAHEWRIDIHGTADYIDQRSPLLRAMGAKVRTFRIDLEQPKVKESEGVGAAFEKWVDEYQPQHGTDKETLKTLLKERVTFGQ